jgi:type I restriction enzyme S subunit
LLTDFEATGSFADVNSNVRVFSEPNYAWYVRATDLEKKTPLSNVKYVDKETYEFLRKTTLIDKEVLIAKRGEIGKVYFFRNAGVPATAAPNTYVLRLKKSLDPFYLYCYLTSPFGNQRLKRINASTTIGALYKDDVKKFKLPTPPLPEQKKIASILTSVGG